MYHPYCSWSLCSLWSLWIINIVDFKSKPHGANMHVYQRSFKGLDWDKIYRKEAGSVQKWPDLVADQFLINMGIVGRGMNSYICDISLILVFWID